MDKRIRNSAVLLAMIIVCLVTTFFFLGVNEAKVSTHKVANSNKEFVEVKSEFKCDKRLMPKLLQAKQHTLNGNLDEAEKLRREVVEEDPTCTDAWIELAFNLYLKEEYENAEQIYLDMLEKFPSDKWIVVSLAMVYSQLNKYEDSFIYYDRALEIDESFGRAHFGIAEEYYKLGDYKNAAIHLKKFLALEPHSKKAAIARKLLNEIES